MITCRLHPLYKGLLLSWIAATCLVAETSTWEKPYLGTDPTVLYLPDENAVYWRYGWKRQPGDQGGLVIEGTMPNARYFSYNVYNDDTKDTLGSFTDFQLKLEGGKDNPFAKGTKASGETYKIHVVPEGTKLDAQNVLYFPDSLQNVSVFLRNYVSEGSITGGVPLPTVQSYLNGKVSPAPASSQIPKLSKSEIKSYLLPMFKKMGAQIESNPEAVLAKLHDRDTKEPLDLKRLIATQVVQGAFERFHKGQPIHSFHLQAKGTYPNKDNLYLTMPVIREPGQALVVRFKAPATVQGPQDYPTAPLRYFSLSQGDDATYTRGSVMDKDMVTDANAMVTFIIGDEGVGLEEKAKALKVNFMPWKVGPKMLLIYRHMLPRADFAHGVDKVPGYDKSKPEKGQEATAAIGEYAPEGRLMDTKAVLAAEKL